MFDKCSWRVTDIMTYAGCSIDHLAEVVCQGTYTCVSLKICKFTHKRLSVFYVAVKFT